MTKEVDTRVRTERPDITNYVDDLFAQRQVHGVSIKECFLAAMTAEEFLRLYHDRLAVQATLHLQEVVDQLGHMAASGDIEAAKLLFDVAGVSGKGGANKGIQNAIQVNITAQEQAQLERDFSGCQD